MPEHHYFQLHKLAHLSSRLEELFALCDPSTLSPEMADEVAATTGEIMLLLADHGGNELVRGALNDAHRLREAARTLWPEPARLAEAGMVLTENVARIIREEKRAEEVNIKAGSEIHEEPARRKASTGLARG